MYDCLIVQFIAALWRLTLATWRCRDLLTTMPSERAVRRAQSRIRRNPNFSSVSRRTSTMLNEKEAMKLASLPFQLVVVALITFFLTADALAKDEEWVSLFNGKNLDGWEKVGDKNSVWEVKDGAIC